MCPDDFTGLPAGESRRDGEAGETLEPSSGSAVQPIDAETRAAVDAKLSEGIFRRSFLKAAALGSAAAALFSRDLGGLQFGPLVAYADDLSGLNCTANDVRIVGPGIILNEPCDCTGTFNAQVRFRVINNTGTTRYCVTVHFCPGKLPDGSTFKPGDIQIGDIPAKSDAFYTVTIPNYPCGSGLVCFGACGKGTDPDTGLPDCSFAKGEDCPAGQCCTTITWDVNPGCPTKVISSKCRHQQVCIQGKSATLTCLNCPVTCGGTVKLQLCASGGTIAKFELTDGTNTYTPTSTSGNCATFEVPVTTTTTFTGKVAYGAPDNCIKDSNPVTVTVQQVTVKADAPKIDCTDASSGTAKVTLSGSATGGENLTLAWTEGAKSLGTGSPLTVDLSAGSHSITLTASNNAGCSASTTLNVVVPDAVKVSLDVSTPANCQGNNLVFTATPSGGVGPYSFEWKIDGALVTANNGTLNYVRNLDCNPHVVSVRVKDSQGCLSNIASKTVTQTVNTVVS